MQRRNSTRQSQPSVSNDDNEDYDDAIFYSLYSIDFLIPAPPAFGYHL